MARQRRSGKTTDIATVIKAQRERIKAGQQVAMPTPADDWKQAG